MKLSLGPLQYFWPRERVLAFYRQAGEWPLDSIYLGETVCSKRRELRTRDWIALAAELAATGKQIVLSSLALLEAESELGALQRLVDNGRFLVEANDMSAVQLCRERGLQFVGGPTLNVYNHHALRLLREDGLCRLVLGVEQGRDLVQALRAAALAAGDDLPELEIIAWGRLPLAYSARCFTARALDIGKDDCGFRCIEHPDGLALATREGQPFLVINGIQVQGREICDLGPELPELREAGIDMLRLYPQAEGMAEVVAHFDRARHGAAAPARLGARNGYWHAEPGMTGVGMEASPGG
jgi:collagenase-like PrtC family protease